MNHIYLKQSNFDFLKHDFAFQGNLSDVIKLTEKNQKKLNILELIEKHEGRHRLNHLSWFNIDVNSPMLNLKPQYNIYVVPAVTSTTEERKRISQSMTDVVIEQSKLTYCSDIDFHTPVIIKDKIESKINRICIQAEYLEDSALPNTSQKLCEIISNFTEEAYKYELALHEALKLELA